MKINKDSEAALNYAKDFQNSEMIAFGFLAGCEHKSKEIETIAIEFAEWIQNNTIDYAFGRAELIDSFETKTTKELFKLYQEEKNK